MLTYFSLRPCCHQLNECGLKVSQTDKTASLEIGHRLKKFELLSNKLGYKPKECDLTGADTLSQYPPHLVGKDTTNKLTTSTITSGFGMPRHLVSQSLGDSLAYTLTHLRCQLALADWTDGQTGEENSQDSFAFAPLCSLPGLPPSWACKPRIPLNCAWVTDATVEAMLASLTYSHGPKSGSAWRGKLALLDALRGSIALPPA